MDINVGNVIEMPEEKAVPATDTDARIEAFTKAFLQQVFTFGSKKSLPDFMQFEGVNCTREFRSGDVITFRLIFKNCEGKR